MKTKRRPSKNDPKSMDDFDSVLKRMLSMPPDHKQRKKPKAKPKPRKKKPA